ncbi:MAG: hypothetical protein WAM53_04055 [Terrimicrobiaceae bacterium]
MSVYQDLVGLCQDIKWRYAYAEDEGAEMWGKDRQLIRERQDALPWLVRE